MTNLNTPANLNETAPASAAEATDFDGFWSKDSERVITTPAYSLTLPSLNSLGEVLMHGSVNISVNVTGYWTGVISSYIRSERVMDENGKKRRELRIDMSHSSGGRDSAAIANDEDAETNFGNAMVDVAMMVRELRTVHGAYVLECIEEAHRQWRAKVEREAAEYEARVAADPAVKEEQAKAMVLLAVAYGKGAVIFSAKRGSDKDDQGTSFEVDENGKGVCFRNQTLPRNVRYSRKEVVQHLMASSAARSTVNRPVAA